MAAEITAVIKCTDPAGGRAVNNLRAFKSRARVSQFPAAFVTQMTASTTAMTTTTVNGYGLWTHALSSVVYNIASLHETVRFGKFFFRQVPNYERKMTV